MQPTQAREILGLPIGYDLKEFRRARRAALSRAHPDRGGTVEMFALVEQAVEALSKSSGSTAGIRNAPMHESFVRRDCPSFTISLLPVEAYELLLIAAAELGDLADDEPPYRMEVRMANPTTWVTLELVPDAGASTVTIVVEAPGVVDVDVVRDMWIDALNGL